MGDPASAQRVISAAKSHRGLCIPYHRSGYKMSAAGQHPPSYPTARILVKEDEIGYLKAGRHSDIKREREGGRYNGDDYEPRISKSSRVSSVSDADSKFSRNNPYFSDSGRDHQWQQPALSRTAQALRGGYDQHRGGNDFYGGEGASYGGRGLAHMGGGMVDNSNFYNNGGGFAAARGPHPMMAAVGPSFEGHGGGYNNTFVPRNLSGPLGGGYSSMNSYGPSAVDVVPPQGPNVAYPNSTPNPFYSHFPQQGPQQQQYHQPPRLANGAGVGGFYGPSGNRGPVSSGNLMHTGIGGRYGTSNINQHSNQLGSGINDGGYSQPMHTGNSYGINHYNSKRFIFS
jgi:hypothetical protein